MGANSLTTRLLGGRFVEPKKGKSSDNAHSPIHPTKSGQELSDVAGRLFEFITRHFLATCSPDARGELSEINIEIATEQFHCKGLYSLITRPVNP